MPEKNPFIIPIWPDLPININVLSTTRCGGVSRAPYDDGFGTGGLNLGSHVADELSSVLRNRGIVQSLVPAQSIYYLSQIHGIDILNAADLSNIDSNKFEVNQADGCFSTQLLTPCAVLTADCLPVLMCDLEGQVVTALHAGWRGMASGILQAGVLKCRSVGGQELTAWLGPAIGATQFEVGQDIFDAFTSRFPYANIFFKPHLRPLKYLADIYGLARMVLNDMGVERVHGGQYCTVTQSELFYSYRRDGVTGRMANIIWKSED
jgi:YfiH family protein